MISSQGPTSSVERPVLVTGATGGIGSELVRLLVASGVPVRAMCRRTEQQRDLAALGATPVLADFDDADSLRAAMTGCDRLFLLTAPLPHQLDQEKRAIDTAIAVGVRHLVRLSAADSNTTTGVPWAQAHAHADHYLADQAGDAMSWTVLRPTAFMQNIAEQAQTIRLGLLPQATGDGVVSWIDTDDIAAVAHRVLTEPGHAGATYLLTGPEPLSMSDIAARLSAHLGRRVRYVRLPGLVYAVVLRLGGQTWWTSRGLQVQFAQVVRRGHDCDTTWEVQRLLGRPARTFDGYLDANLDAFSGRRGSVTRGAGRSLTGRGRRGGRDRPV